MNPLAVNTLRDLDDAACDQDDRQLALIRKAKRLFERIEEVRGDPQAVLTLARVGQENQTTSEAEELEDKSTNDRRREITRALARMPKKEQPTP